MKRFSKIFILLTMFIPFIAFNATSGKGIDSLEASYPPNCDTPYCDLTISGIAKDDTLAVAILVYNDTESEVVTMLTTSVNNNHEFEETINLPKKNYIVKAADYDGGIYKVEIVSDNSMGVSDAEAEAQGNTINSDLQKIIGGDTSNLDNKYDFGNNDLSGYNDLEKYDLVPVVEDMSSSMNMLTEAAGSMDELNTIANEAGTNEIKNAALYDVDIVIEYDDVEIGKVTELKESMTMSLDLPETLPPVASGFKRIFRIILTHTTDQGTQKYIINDVTERAGKVFFKNKLFSKMFIVYYDKEQPIDEEESGIRIKQGYTYLRLYWEENSSYSGYKIYRKVSGGSYSVIKTITSKSTTYYKDTTVLPGKTYYYKVRPYKVSSGKTKYGDYTPVVSGSIKKPLVTTASLSPSYSYIKLTWDKKTSGRGYKIYRSTEEDSGFKLIKTITSNTVTSFKDMAALPGKTYYYKIKTYRVVNGKNNLSVYSNVVNGSLKKPLATELTINSYSSYIKIAWDKVTSGRGYKIYRSTGEDSKFKLISTITSNSTTNYRDKSVKKGVTYYYKIKTYRVVNGKNNLSDYSNIESGSID